VWSMAARRRNETLTAAPAPLRHDNPGLVRCCGKTKLGWGRNIEPDSYGKEPCKVEGVGIGNPFGIYASLVMLARL
jgi:hypothetical protein